MLSSASAASRVRDVGMKLMDRPVTVPESVTFTTGQHYISTAQVLMDNIKDSKTLQRFLETDASSIKVVQELNIQNSINCAIYLGQSPLSVRILIYNTIILVNVKGVSYYENAGVLFEKIMPAAGVANVALTKDNKRKDPVLFSQIRALIQNVREKAGLKETNVVFAAMADYKALGEIHQEKMITFPGAYNSLENAIFMQCYSSLKTRPAAVEVKKIKDNFFRVLPQWCEGLYELADHCSAPLDIFCSCDEQYIENFFQKESKEFQQEVKEFQRECLTKIREQKLSPKINSNYFRQEPRTQNLVTPLQCPAGVFFQLSCAAFSNYNKLREGSMLQGIDSSNNPIRVPCAEVSAFPLEKSGNSTHLPGQILPLNNPSFHRSELYQTDAMKALFSPIYQNVAPPNSSGNNNTKNNSNNSGNNNSNNNNTKRSDDDEDEDQGEGIKDDDEEHKEKKATTAPPKSTFITLSSTPPEPTAPNQGGVTTAGGKTTTATQGGAAAAGEKEK